MPWRIAFKACCTRRQDNWNWRHAPSSRLWQWIRGWGSLTGSPDTMRLFSAAPMRRGRRSSGRCASIRPIGDTASGSSLADLPSCCSAAPKRQSQLLQKSLERNPSYGSAQLFLMAALSLVGREAKLPRRPHPSASNTRITGRPHSSSCGCRVRVLRPIAPKFIHCSRRSARSAWRTEARVMSRSKDPFLCDTNSRAAAALPPRLGMSRASIIAGARRPGVRVTGDRTRGNPVAVFVVEHCRGRGAVAQSDRRCRPETFWKPSRRSRRRPHRARSRIFAAAVSAGAGQRQP